MIAYIVMGGYSDRSNEDSVYTVRLSEKEAENDVKFLKKAFWEEYDGYFGPDNFWIEYYDTDRKVEDILI